MNQKSVRQMFIVASVIVAMIGTVALTASSMTLFSHKAVAATAVSSVGAPSNVTKNKPVEGYDNAQGYFTAIKHVYNDPNLRLSLFCKPGLTIVATCQIYDSSLPNAHLIGIEYIITAKDYNSLPTEDKPNWYIIDKKLSTIVQGHFPELNAQQINVVLQHLLGNYGKIILTWNPLNHLPTSSPRTENLQNLFVVNQTSTNSSSTSK
ncbi:MAG TPA: DUF1264 domain-containing protein [Candidatus Nitrosopolaris sp.]|nr:DUF1264 domain-containing protein [Candidatus Nitrosopolaris sp.]